MINLSILTTSSFKIPSNLVFFSASFALGNNSDAAFNDANGFLISCVRSDANLSANSIRLYKLSVIPESDLDKLPISSRLRLILLIILLSG